MYKTLRKIHLWLAVPLGLVMSLICATGLLLLFEPAHAGGSERSEFFLSVMRLHRWLFDAPAVKGAMTPGKMIVAISTCCMALVLITGIMLWWKQASKNLAHSLKITAGHGMYQFWRSLHTAGGAYVVLFLLVMALTGLTWSFGWYRAGFNALFGIEKGSHVVYMIHSGAFGGILTKVIWGIAVLIGFTLPLTGYYMWLHRIAQKKRMRGAGSGK